MSINVTVTGNPVSIKRGKMVCFDPNNSKKEFEKRRIMRLQQVRQQSKELAENVRNKVKNEKKKQLGEIEREGKEKLKNWQNRKLLELQDQYRNALDEIGSGHKNANELLDEEEDLEDQKIENERQARDRGRVAKTKDQIQKNEENYRKAMPIQQKKLVRDIENTRAAMVSSIKKQKNNYCHKKVKKPKSLANIDITIPDDSDFSEELPATSHLPDITEEQSDESEGSEGFCECTESSEEKSSEISSTDSKERNKENIELHSEVSEKPVRLSNEKITTEEPQKTEESFSKFRSLRESLDIHRGKIEKFRQKNTSEVSMDTRISDRIKNRKLISLEPDFSDFKPGISGKKHFPKPEEQSKNVQKDPLELSSDECLCTKYSRKCLCNEKISKKISSTQKVETSKSDLGKHFQQKFCKNVMEPIKEIPSMPGIKLKDVDSVAKSTHSGVKNQDSQKVRHFDFPNRFEKEVSSALQFEKVTADSIEVLPNSDSELEWREKMKQRDREAQIRGRNALEKEKIQRNYEEMMKQLPILQRKENIAQIGTDKPEYHMSDERLKEKELQRQIRLENAYSKAMPELKPKIVTIPSRKHEILKPEEPFQILDGDDSRVLNLGKWDIDSKPKTMFSAEEVQDIIKAFTVQKPEDRRAKLKNLLKNLKLQKEQLLNEIKSLPMDDSVNALISDLNSFSDSDEKHHKVKKRKHKEVDDKRRRLDDETELSSVSLEKGVKPRHKDREERTEKKKSRKQRPEVLILQNTSTQTTPKQAKDKSTSSSTSDTSKELDIPVKRDICKKSHMPCDCNKEDVKDLTEELCKILIKLHDDEVPEVEVVSSSRSKGDQSDKSGEVEKKTEKEYKEKSPDRTTKSSKADDIKSPPKKDTTTKRIPPKKPKETRSVATETDKPKKPDKIPEKSSRHHQFSKESWKEQLSKNSISTSSTSYFSPPDYSRPNTTASTEASLRSFYNLHDKPKQKNLEGSSLLKLQQPQKKPLKVDSTDVQLLNYIKRVLSMSKASLDDLGVSSSEVQTPNQSIIDIESNNPMGALQNIAKIINIKAADLEKRLNGSPEDSRVPPNSLISGSEGSNKSKDKSQYIPEKDVPDAEGSACQFADVSDSCSKRIANLAAMIEKLRQEKIQMLRKSPVIPHDSDHRVITPTSDRDNSTKYFDFPHSEEKSVASSSTTSMDEEELNRRLLDIDMSLAEKLRKFRQTKDDKVGDSGEKSDRSEKEPDQVQQADDEQDQQFLQRLQRLIAESYEKDQSDPVQLPKSPAPLETPPVPFVPLLLDIPKLPILEAQPECHALCQSNGLGRKYPPPSKGLTTAKKFNGNISLIPHELSTIVEADSQISTKVSPSISKTQTSPTNILSQEILPLKVDDVQLKSPDSSKEQIKKSFKPVDEELELLPSKTDDIQLKSPEKSKQKIEGSLKPVDEPKEMIPESPPSKKPFSHVVFDENTLKSFKSLDASDSNRSLACTESTCTSACLSSVSSKKTSSSSSDMESIEAMLRSIGMEWAIPTLHKTQEALALSSSSSSSNVGQKKRNKSGSTTASEVDLKEFLKKQMMSKISSSSLKSDSSPASFIQELSDISAINPNNSSVDKTKRRTSTPVLSSKSTSKSKDDHQPLFTGTSDISSVRNTSCDTSTCQKKAGGRQDAFHTLGSDGDLTATKSPL